ncbi:uncharacterized protein EURHEDRAFT_412225 [Aspergillus ruber CBS 135680]|uniref:ADP-ribosylation factor n=1 Tax=Aspergillus ruber (strain CBS 135680) TaxID=1388766 RepID=A0A017SEM0_ASPRC|nr:uncharacterized protein EURHEDRAFT_412225 [Aspergillus ruber CBS 135680]EYE95407.1 hypothetical protein EURHEDRAFT_412225 [Aspergillus ruber CBS 135680]
MTESSSWAFQKPYEYYSSFENQPHLCDKFRDIDDEANFRTYLHLLEDAHTHNFVLDFGNEDAWCAVDLERDDIASLLCSPRPRCIGTRWINIWAPEEQKKMIKTIMSHYGVSERLQGMMCTEPVVQIPTPKPEEPVPSSPGASTLRSRRSRHKSFNQPSQTRVDDLESGVSLGDLDTEEIHRAASFKGLTFAQVANQIWHFCSVDHGPRYTCIGYNSLYVTSKVQISNGKDLPDGKRLWSWLILFDDGTVVSIQENPYPRPAGPLPDEARTVLGTVRRNIRFIFSGVSSQHSATSESESLVTIRVRGLNSSAAPDQSIKQEDSPSLLFYYIFDDWFSSYSLVAKREHKYGVTLDQLREDMLTRPAVELVDELHWLGRQLAVLKRVYQSYELIMWRLLQRQRLLREEAKNRPAFTIGNAFMESEFGDLRQPIQQSNLSLISNYDTQVGVQLSSASVARFERLLDRIKLYCLSEIDACLVEKESLTFLNFNLIALKDSQAVERLTRVTVLLAKVTILFLPVSLMTGYFSTELVEVKGVYTINQYWVSFGVIVFLSFVLLVVFGVASDTVEGKTIYASLFRTFFRFSRHRMSRPGREGVERS